MMYIVYDEVQAAVDSVVATAQLIEHIFNNKKCAFIDFSKAFDHVSRNHPWHKVIKLGICGKALTFLRSVYHKGHKRSDRTFCLQH